MKYTVYSDKAKNMDGMRAPLNCYEVEALSAIDAAIKAAKVAGQDEEIIETHENDDNGIVVAYRLEDGTYEFHVNAEDNDMAFTL